ncbi:MAG: mannose-1-phosphate guanyltransferase [Chlorobiaceae bacterium]|nr:mannose-1-phosphate guanyltransferase [Chlorobiaceae bacterium]
MVNTGNFSSHVYAVIMAGGIGSKLWPLSRKRHPKQFLHFFDGGTMIRKTVERIARTVRMENILIITTKQHWRLILDSLPDFDTGNIIIEPAVRDTATCIALATTFIRKRDPDAVTVVLPADHLVHDEERFLRTVEKGVCLAREKQGLITVGIHPDRPETRYGYIQVEASLLIDDENNDPDDDDIALFRVKTFAEKPDIATAEQFLQSRDFWWNSGVFIWHVDDINREFQRSLPDLYEDMQNVHTFIGTERQESVIEDVYSWIHPVSIAYGIMEKAEKVFMLAGDFGWTDLGCWDEVIKVGLGLEGRDMDGREVIMIDSNQVFVRKPHGKAVVTIGVDDIIVVDTPDALLICRKGQSVDVSKAVEVLRREPGLEGFL